MENNTTTTPGTEKIKIRGLARISGWIFLCWGSLIAFAGIYHAFLGEPEANFYSPEKWQFVTQKQWLRWNGFEIAYGLSCIGIGILCWEYGKRLPEWITRGKKAASGLLG